jgi:UDP-N-acetyl-D-mannosaminuronic acid dehydrogenase
VKVSVIGLGYIGLPTAAILASKGLEVTGTDTNNEVVEIINQGKVHIVEPKLDILVQSAIKSGKLIAKNSPNRADFFIIAVPTPLKEKLKPDLSYIKTASKAIAPLLQKGNVVILESTSPVGTTEKMINWLKKSRPDLNFPSLANGDEAQDISVAYCPERVIPGNAVQEIVENDRIIGGVTSRCAENAKKLYDYFVKSNCILTDCKTAELSKLVENSFRDTNIAFANELSLICDKLNINVWELIKLANLHPRVNILQPGPGVGGHCIAIDPWFIVDSAPKESLLISTARRVNEYKPKFILNKIKKTINDSGKDKSKTKIACLGLTFKPNVDDLRESPALAIAREISSWGVLKTYLVEPNIQQIPQGFDKKDTELVDLDFAIKNSDLIVLLVDHDVFKTVSVDQLFNKLLIDTRGVWTSQ